MKRALLALLIAACSTAPATTTSPAPAGAPVTGPVTATEPSKVIALEPGPSIYDLETPMTDATGGRIKLDVDRGHVTVIAMFYGACAVSCPVTVADIKQTLATLPAAAQRDVRVLLVSFDPARDTPAVLATLAKQHQLDDRWTLAVPSDTDARTLAATIGVKYRKLDDGQMAHNLAITVLDGEGRPIARAEQFGQQAGLARVITEAVAPRPNT
jgi:protein SCO1/2